jgi:putative addiction module component (TIGR02574 family)
MLKTMATLTNIVSGLSEAEKLNLIDALWVDLESHPPSVTAEQADELDRRIAEYEKNLTACTPWEQVKAGLPRR